MGRYSNPFAYVLTVAEPHAQWSNRSRFGEQSLSDIVSIRRLCSQLDKWIEDGHDGTGTMVDFGASPESFRNDNDLQIDHYLECAIQGFAARWLPLIFPVEATAVPRLEIVRSLWRRAHRDMLKVINRPSYRSMLALLLFALTPIPVGITEDEELDGVSGQHCVHAALQQIQTLRARQRSLQFNGTRVSLASVRRTSATSPQSLATTNFINAESTAYWAALTFDTSASLTMSCRPLLSSGLFGFDAEPSWRMVRTCTEIFKGMTKDWKALDFEMTNEKANQIIASGAAWKLLQWKLTANLKESLRDGHDEVEVDKAFNAVSDAIDHFNATYRDLLSACQTRIQFFSQETKLRWCKSSLFPVEYSGLPTDIKADELVMHYNLSILMVPDIVATTHREDLLSLFSSKRMNAETWVMNCLEFGLNNKYTIQLRSEIGTSDPKASLTQENSITVPLVAVDPYPHHVVAAVKLMQQAIERDSARGKIGPDAYNNLLSTLRQTLEQLPQGSKSVQMARADFAKPENPSQPAYPPW